MRAPLSLALLALLVATACSSAPLDAPPPPLDAEGPYAVGHRTLTLTDTTRDRILTVELWYPADVSGLPLLPAEGVPMDDAFFPSNTADHDAYRALLDAAPEGCPTTHVRLHRDAPFASDADPRPLLLFSHCHTCTRFSSNALAQHLAGHGFLVAAPDHAGNTLFDNDDWELTADNLDIRATDMRFVLDTLLADATLPLDATRIGVFGHSFGSVTAGRVAELDPRIRAAAGIAAPFENPLIPGVTLANITQPLLFVIAREDNSITEFGNLLIRNNFKAANTPAYKLEVDDAGHWSFSDIAGLTEDFMPGCGDDLRGTSTNTPFTYLDPSVAQDIVRGRIAAFFAAHLLDDPDALILLTTPHASELTTIESR